MIKHLGIAACIKRWAEERKALEKKAKGGDMGESEGEGDAMPKNENVMPKDVHTALNYMKDFLTDMVKLSEKKDVNGNTVYIRWSTVQVNPRSDGTQNQPRSIFNWVFRPRTSLYRPTVTPSSLEAR